MSKQVGSMRRKGIGYELRVSTNRKDAKGNYIYKTKMAHGTERQVKKVLAQFVTEVMEGKHDAEKISFKSFLDQRFATWKANLSPTTYQGYELIAKNHVIPFFGKYDMRKITPELVQRYYNETQSSGRLDGKGKSLSGSTMKKHHTFLHKVFADAVRWKHINSNPTDYVDKPKAESNERAFLTIDELKELNEITQYGYWGELTYVLSWTGMRLGEALGLQWGDINFDGKFLSIQRSQAYIHATNELVDKSPKTKSSIRRIHLGASLLEYLRSMKENHLNIYGDVANTSKVFRNLDGSPMMNQSATHGIKKALKQMGRGDASCHSLRHSHASALLSSGSPLKVVSERLGHSTIAITADLYTHVAPNIQEMHIDNLERLMNGESPQQQPDNITKLVVNE